MAVLAVATAARCKLCQHPRRTDIDALLEDRSRRRKDADGKQINLKYVLEKFAEWGVENPNEDNVSNHVRKHVQFVDDTVQAEAVAAAQERVNKHPREAGRGVEGDLKWIIDVGIAEVEERIARGEKSGVTLDHVMKAAAELSRRSHSESQRELLGALVGGIGQALAPARPMKQLPDADVIDGEFFEAETLQSEVEA